MITFMEPKEKFQEPDKCLDSQLWHACAGSMVQIPPVNSPVFYFPQGHIEHSSENIDFRKFPKIPSFLPCRVSNVKFMADPLTDEVFAKIQVQLIPLPESESNFDSNLTDLSENQEKPASFAKTLTQSDANNGGGFSVPRYCAETIFPRLDYSSDPPVQTVLAKDVHGETWKFRHIYRGTPRRHLLTTGWSTFVNSKRLVAGDSIVFLRSENGELCVGIRRAKRGVENSLGWNLGFSTFLRENGNSVGSGNLVGKELVRGESVIEAVNLAAEGRSFEVVYFPRASTPEFVVRAAVVRAAIGRRWCGGLRFKMAFETEDSSRISWFMGTVSGVQVADPVRWPESPWRLLQVIWDEPDLLQNVKRVSPWLVEPVPNLPSIHLPTFAPPPFKKLKLQNRPEFSHDGQIHPFLFGNYNTPAGMQGARHAQSGLLSSTDFRIPSSFFPVNFFSNERAILPNYPSKHSIENVSCTLTMGNSTQESRKSEKTQAPFVLFGQQILTKKQISKSCSSEMTVSPSSEGKTGNASDGSGSGLNQNNAQSELDLDSGPCKVFMEPDDGGQTIDLSLLGSFEELYIKLGNMYGIEITELRNRVVYRDVTGAVRQLGEETFSNMVKNARRLTILAEVSTACNSNKSKSR